MINWLEKNKKILNTLKFRWFSDQRKHQFIKLQSAAFFVAGCMSQALTRIFILHTYPDCLYDFMKWFLKEFNLCLCRNFGNLWKVQSKNLVSIKNVKTYFLLCLEYDICKQQSLSLWIKKDFQFEANFEVYIWKWTSLNWLRAPTISLQKSSLEAHSVSHVYCHWYVC